MDSKINERPTITVDEFLRSAPSHLHLQLLAGSNGLTSHRITTARIQKLGLALAGFSNYVRPGRIQIAGQSEIWYLERLASDKRDEAIYNLRDEEISSIIITKDLNPPERLIELCNERGVPLFKTHLVSSVVIGIVTEFLQEKLAPRDTRHGVLLDLYGVGVLIEGSSGVGKSECALDLIARGHRLVSDDVVEVRRIGPDKLTGNAPALIREHLEIRGLGIINIRDLFGVSAIGGPIRISLSIRLERWDDIEEVDRLGIDSRAIDILGVSVPHVLLPVSPGRNLSTLVETAVRVHLLRQRGYDAAQSFVARHAATIEAKDSSGI
jgi:HPr kinase/phosphorylase